MGNKKRKDIPKYDLGLIETHCHLDYLKQNTLEDILLRCQEHHIEKIITISVEPKNLAVVKELAKNNSIVYGTQGIHPHEAKFVTDKVLEEIKSNLNEDKIIAIGEIGLDYHYNHSPREIQIEVFEK